MAIVFPATAQFAEPILTRTAIPEAPGEASLQLLFVNPVGTGISQALPEARLEIGLGEGFEAMAQVPLLRIAEPNGGNILGGGQVSAALQYLIAGSLSAGYALSFAVRVEGPSGDSAIVGNQTQIMPTALVEWRPRRPLVFRSNIGWDRAVAGSSRQFAFLEYDNALSWTHRTDVVPAIEVVGSTDTLRWTTELVVQPEVILAVGRHMELKAGPSFELAPNTSYAIRAEISLFRRFLHP